MTNNQLPVHGTKTFEELKLTNEYGAEYWSARDLQSLLGYTQWRRFEQAIERAMTSCEAFGKSAKHHFAGAGKPITGGKGAVQVVNPEEDNLLDRKIPKQVLSRCEWGHDEYSLQVENLPQKPPELGQQELEL